MIGSFSLFHALQRPFRQDRIVLHYSCTFQQALLVALLFAVFADNEETQRNLKSDVLPSLLARPWWLVAAAVGRSQFVALDIICTQGGEGVSLCEACQGFRWHSSKLKFACCA